MTPISGSHSQQKSDAPRPAVARGRHIAAAFGLSLTLLTLLLLGACVGRNVPPPDPMARFRPAMKPEFQSDLDTLGPVPVYAIEVEVAPDNAELRGSSQVWPSRCRNTFTVASSSSMAATISPFSAVFC